MDNAGFFPVGNTPAVVPDKVLYDALMSEFPMWLGSARAMGILG